LLSGCGLPLRSGSPLFPIGNCSRPLKIELYIIYTYSSERTGNDETHFKTYHLELGDSFEYNKKKTNLSLLQLRMAMSVRYPTTTCAGGSLKYYLSLSQKELVEFGYGCHQSHSTFKHCLALLPPGGGKSETYLIPIIARILANMRRKIIIHKSPYRFLAAYQYASAKKTMEKMGFHNVSTGLFLGGDIREGHDGLPTDLSSPEFLPSLIFLNIDAVHNLVLYFEEELRSWIDCLDKIVLDKVHTVFTEMNFRKKIRVLSRLPSLGVRIIALTGSMPPFVIPRFGERFCLTTPHETMRVIHGGDVTGQVPLGFKIDCRLKTSYFIEVYRFVRSRVLNHAGAIHVFVAEMWVGEKLLKSSSENVPGFTYHFVSSKTDREEVNSTSSAWSHGTIDILITTSMGLVGNENPHCRFLCIAGHLYDPMQITKIYFTWSQSI